MKKNKKIKTEEFNPSGVGINNGHFIGLPYEEEESDIVLISVPWDVTVSFGEGTSTGAKNILECSPQLDLYDEDAPNIWKRGIYLRPLEREDLSWNEQYRNRAKEYIQFLERGGEIEEDQAMQNMLSSINRACRELKDYVKEQTTVLLKQNKIVGLVGGDHSTPLGFLEALAEKYTSFGILQVDAHMDLRNAYEGFKYSHASIFYNALQIPNISKIVQVGIRDYCEEEVQFAAQHKERVEVFYEHQIRRAQFSGVNYQQIIEKIVNALPEKVYITVDIDGLDPSLCPNTGTPVPGGLQLQELFYLLKAVADSGKTIIGFDLCEVAGTDHHLDGNVGARVLYKLCCMAGLTNK